MAHHGNANGGIPAIHRTYFNLQEISEPNLTIDNILSRTESGTVTDAEFLQLGEWIATHTGRYPKSWNIPRATGGLYRIDMVQEGNSRIIVSDGNNWDPIRGGNLYDGTTMVQTSEHGDKTLTTFKSETYLGDGYLKRTIYKITRGQDGTTIITLALYQKRGVLQ